MSKERKTLEELNVMDNFMTNKLSTDERVKEQFCRLMVKALLGRETGRISIHAEHVIPGLEQDFRGIRMDVEIEEYAGNPEDTDLNGGNNDALYTKSVYDIEPHNRNDVCLPKRNRFYQARRDGRYLESGTRDFIRLPELIMISILPYDPFGYDRMVYTVSNICHEVPELMYGDGLKFIYFYTKGKLGGTDELRRFLKYLEDSREENAVDDNTRRMHELIKVMRRKPEMEDEYMTWGEYIDSERMEQAEETAKDTRIEAILELLEDFDDVPASLNDTLQNIDDIAELKRLHKIAAKAGSIDEFMKELAH